MAPSSSTPTVAVLKQCIQDARRLLETFEDHGIDEVECGDPASRDALLKACGSDLTVLLRRLGSLSTARLAAAAPVAASATDAATAAVPAAAAAAEDQEKAISEEPQEPASRPVAAEAEVPRASEAPAVGQTAPDAPAEAAAQRPAAVPAAEPAPMEEERQAAAPAVQEEAARAEAAVGGAAALSDAGAEEPPAQGDADAPEGAATQESMEVDEDRAAVAGSAAAEGKKSGSRWKSGVMKAASEGLAAPEAAEGDDERAGAPAADGAAADGAGSPTEAPQRPVLLLPRAALNPRGSLLGAPGKRVTDFREATAEEVAIFPAVQALFEQWLEKKDDSKSETTRKCYANSVWTLFRYDQRAPEEMATDEYRRAVKRTLEDRSANSVQSASIKQFSDFWHEQQEQIKNLPAWIEAQSDDVKKRLQKLAQSTRLDRLSMEQTGDGSEEARKAHGLDLPDGWRVHSSTSGNRTIGWSSPGGNFYYSRSAVKERVNPEPPKFHLTEVLVTPAPKGKKRTAELAALDMDEDADANTPDKCVKPLAELLASAPELGPATAEDRNMLPRVLTTFARFLSEQASDRQRQTTRDCYVLLLFKAFSQCGRSLDAIAQPRFVEILVQSEEHRKNRSLCTAVRAFQRFWSESGGSAGNFDQADRDWMNVVLQVRPLLADAAGQCGALVHGLKSCTRPNQNCVTCGCRLRCAIHGEHSVQECREIFWTKHSRQGIRLRTMADFFKPPAAAGALAAAAMGAGDGAAAGETAAAATAAE